MKSITQLTELTPEFTTRQLILLLVGVAAVLVISLFLSMRFWMQSSVTHDLLQALWSDYKEHYWDAGNGRTFATADHATTTSEAQAYTMLRAVGENDQLMFAKTWNWTLANLQRPDKLFSWQWQRQVNGSFGVTTTKGGQNTASDADSDIALALVLAGARWHNGTYLTAARAIVPAVWDKEVVTVGSRPVLAADDIEKTTDKPTIIVNPSYFAPAAYRLFALVDPGHDWNGLAQNAYNLILTVSLDTLDVARSVGLPPNWIAIDRSSGQPESTGNAAQTTDFGFDALRTMWQAGVDWQWFHAAQAKQALAQFSFLSQQWLAHHSLVAVYGHDGQPKADYQSIAMYGGTLGYFTVIQPSQADAIVTAQLLPLYNARTHRLSRSLNYYDNNWAWFGLKVYTHDLPNWAAARI